MDLLQTVRKEGSRGGVNFSWDDVKSSQHRENYLGHSLKAPVGRWQKGKDLGWYAQGDDDDAELTPEQRAERERKAKREEMRKVKEAEEDAMARALGLPVPERGNANLEPLGLSEERRKEVDKALKETLEEDGAGRDERGVGFGGYGGRSGDGGKEVMKGSRARDEDRARGIGIETGAGSTAIVTMNGQDHVPGSRDEDPGHVVGIEGAMKMQGRDGGAVMIDHEAASEIANGQGPEVDLALRTRGGDDKVKDETVGNNIGV